MANATATAPKPAQNNAPRKKREPLKPLYTEDQLNKMTPDQRKAAIKEIKQQNFKRLAKARAVKILRTLDNLGSLSSSAYSYSQEQVDNVFDTIETYLKSTKAKFQPKKEGEGEKDYGINL